MIGMRADGVPTAESTKKHTERNTARTEHPHLPRLLRDVARTRHHPNKAHKKPRSKTMNTIKQTGELSVQRARRMASALAVGASTAFATILRPAFRRRLAAAGAAAAVAAGSLLTPQPAAAATAYPVTVTYDNVKFTM